MMKIKIKIYHTSWKVFGGRKTWYFPHHVYMSCVKYFLHIGIRAVRGLFMMNIVFSISCDYFRVIGVGSGAGGERFLPVMNRHNGNHW
jgi:hypothetical protein